LHGLPFESLVLGVDEKAAPIYLLDRFPPTVYAPSANIMTRLRRRSSVSQDAKRRLLSVADPIYDSTPEAEIVDARRAGLSSTTFVAVHRDLPPLPGTAVESDRITNAFRKNHLEVSQLLRESATESALRDRVRNCGWLHIAAHGLVDESYGNLFGG